MRIIKAIKRYFSAEARIARLLRKAANIAGENYYQIAYGQLSDRAKEFEKCQKQ